MTVSDDNGLRLLAQNSCNCERPVRSKTIPDLAAQERPKVSETLKAHEVCKSRSSMMKAMMMSVPCCVLRVVEQELVVLGHVPSAAPSTASVVWTLAAIVGWMDSGSSPAPRIIVIDVKMLRHFPKDLKNFCLPVMENHRSMLAGVS